MQVHSQMYGSSYQITVDNRKLEEIFGFKPILNFNQIVGDMIFKNGTMIELTGNFIEIIAKPKKYTVSPVKFSKRVNSAEMTGNGYFEGPEDEIGKKIFNLFFCNHKDGEIVYINDVKTRIWRSDNGLIENFNIFGSEEKIMQKKELHISACRHWAICMEQEKTIYKIVVYLDAFRSNLDQLHIIQRLLKLANNSSENSFLTYVRGNTEGFVTSINFDNQLHCEELMNKLGALLNPTSA